MRGNATVILVSVETTKSDMGDTTTETTETTIPGCAVAPRGTVERADPRFPSTITGKTIYLPASAPAVDSDDKVRIDGVLYEVDGEEGSWVSPFTGRRFGFEVAVKRWEQP